MQRPENADWFDATGKLLRECTGSPKDKEKIVNDRIAHLKQRRSDDEICREFCREMGSRTTCKKSETLDFGGGNVFHYCNSNSNGRGQVGCKKFRMEGGECPHGSCRRVAVAKEPRAVKVPRAVKRAAGGATPGAEPVSRRALKLVLEVAGLTAEDRDALHLALATAACRCDGCNRTLVSAVHVLHPCGHWLCGACWTGVLDGGGTKCPVRQTDMGGACSQTPEEMTLLRAGEHALRRRSVAALVAEGHARRAEEGEEAEAEGMEMEGPVGGMEGGMEDGMVCAECDDEPDEPADEAGAESRPSQEEPAGGAGTVSNRPPTAAKDGHADEAAPAAAERVDKAVATAVSDGPASAAGDQSNPVTAELIVPLLPTILCYGCKNRFPPSEVVDLFGLLICHKCNLAY